MIPFFFSSKTIAWAEAGIMIVIVLFSFNQWQRMKTQRSELETMRVALQNPKTVEVIKRVAGPVRIKTVLVERPSGEKETTTTEERGEVREETDLTKEPVSLRDLSLSVRTDRWLVGASNRGLSFKDAGAYGVWGGYSFRNRVDVLLGVTKNERLNANLMVVLRF